MVIPQQFKLKNTIKYPTSILVGGLSKLGLEIAESLLEQGGYVILIDTVTEENVEKLNIFSKDTLISFLDYSSIPHLEDEIRRLDYVFYFNHESTDYYNKISTQEFLTFSNYLDAVLSLTSKFEAKLLLTSSIKVNQVLLSDSDVGLDFGAGSSVTHIYREMEMQKYAEGLVIEYGEKVKLDVRIVRLGEIIGDGMNFNASSTFTQLILEAVRGENLQLHKDGLENEWFIHLLDAAYALIKAQFSKGTAGKIFSACYDSSFSHLSIAYKILESIEKPIEIRFIKEDDNLPILKLYKPAKNLSDIGWMPRVTFDKAVRESLASAKIFLAEKNIQNIQKSSRNNLSDKLKGFLSLAKEPDMSFLEKDVMDDVADSKKRDDTLRKNRIEIAGKDLRAKRSRRPKNSREKFQDGFWKVFIQMSKVFSIFRNKSPMELGGILFSLIILIVVYFTLIAPTIFVSSKYISANLERSYITKALETKDYVDLYVRTNKVDTLLNDNIDILSKYNDAASFLTFGEEFDEFMKVNEAYSLAANGLKDIAIALEPISQYQDQFKNNLQIRTGNESYLSVSGNGLDFSSEFNEAKDHSTYVNLGLEKIQKSLDLLKNINYSNLPSSVFNKLNEINEDIKTYSALVQSSYYEKYIPELLGADLPTTHLVLVLDNTRLTPIGGDIAAFGLFTFNKGAITESIVLPINEEEFVYTEQIAEELDHLNVNRFNAVDSNEITIEDFSSITNLTDFSRNMRSIFGSKYNREIDGVIVINLETLSNLLAINEIGSVDISGIEFTSQNFINSLDNMQPNNQSIQTRRDIIAQVFANIGFKLFDNYQEVYPDLLKEISLDYAKQNILANFEKSDIQKPIDKAYVDVKADADTFLEVSFLMDDPTLVNVGKYTDVNIALETKILQDLSLTQSVNLQFSDLGASQELSLCLPLDVPTDSIKLSGENVSLLRTTITEGASEKCIVTKLIGENSITVNWDEPSAVTASDDTELKFGFLKVKGARTTLDHNVTLDPGLELVNTKPLTSFSANVAGYNMQLTTDTIVQFEIQKN